MTYYIIVIFEVAFVAHWTWQWIKMSAPTSGEFITRLIFILMIRQLERVPTWANNSSGSYLGKLRNGKNQFHGSGGGVGVECSATDTEVPSSIPGVDWFFSPKKYFSLHANFSISVLHLPWHGWNQSSIRNCCFVVQWNRQKTKMIVNWFFAKKWARN